MFMRLVIFIMVLQSLVFAAPGDLDTSFGSNGKVFTDFRDHGDESKGIAIQSNGRIVVAGWSSDSSGDKIFAVARYDTSGSLDTSFGTGGKVTTNAGGKNNGAHSIAIQSDGKIVAAGKSDTSGSYNWEFALVRYDIDGNPDATFGTNGIVITPVGTGTNGSYANSVAIQSDSKIVAAGRSHTGGYNYDFALVRYDINGSLDATFNGDGKVTTAIGSFTSIAKSVAIQENGKIVALGYVETFTDYDFALVRYDINGSLDKTFGTDGIVTTDVDGQSDKATSMVIQSDGKIVVAGFSSNGDNWDFALVRYDINGSLDTNFGTNGIVITAISDDDSDEPYAIAIQSDGKIVVAGSSEINSNTNFAIVRYNTDGSLDTTFGTDGKVTTDMGGGEGGAQGVAIQSDGKIVAAGVGNDGGDQDFSIARYQGKSMVLTPIYYLLGM